MYVSSLNYHIISLRAVADTGNTYMEIMRILPCFLYRRDPISPSVERLNFLYAYRPGMVVDKTTNASIPPGPTASNRDTPVGIIDFYVAHTHAHEGALRKMTNQM